MLNDALIATAIVSVVWLIMAALLLLRRAADRINWLADYCQALEDAERREAEARRFGGFNAPKP